MPRAFDPSNYIADFNPLTTKTNSWDLGNLAEEAVEALIQAAEMWVQFLITEIKNLTGIDLNLWTELVTNLAQAFGLGDDVNTIILFVQGIGGLFKGIVGGESLPSLIDQFVAVIVLAIVPQSAGTAVELVNFFTGFTGAGSLLTQLINAAGGVGSTIEDLGSALAHIIATLPTDLEDVADWLTNFLVPAGALSTFTEIPAHLFGNLGPGRSANLLPDPGFDDASTLVGQSMWTWDGTVGNKKPGSAKTVAAGVTRQLIGVPIATAAEQVTTLTATTLWSGVTAGTGNAIVLAANAYDSDDNLISDPTNRVIQAITTPVATQAAWQTLTGDYQAPAGTAYVRICLEVDATVTAGTVWFDDCSQELQSGLVDAALLANIENIPLIGGLSVAGIAGIEDLVTTFGHLLDGLGSAYNQSPLSDLNFSDLFSLAQNTASNAESALEHALNSIGILGNRTNKPVTTGFDPTTEATFALSNFTDAASISTATVVPGESIIGMMRVSEVATKGFFEFMAQRTGTSTGVFVNVYKVDTTTGIKTALWNSADISSLVSNSSLTWATALIPGASQPTVNASDLLALEIVNAGTANLIVAAKSIPIPNHPTAYPTNFGATRPLAMHGGSSPASISDLDIAYSSIIPYISFGIENVPADFQPPEVTPFTAAGTFTYTIPSWMKAGDLIDGIAIGGGGGGGAASFFATGQGGGPAVWAAQTLVYGTDIPLTTTALTVVVGTGGIGGISAATSDPGFDGNATTISGTGMTTITAAGGPAGFGGPIHNPANHNAGSGGVGPGNELFNDQTYFGGPNVGTGQRGGIPGGGGGGGNSFGGGFGGAIGSAWIVARQAA